MLKNYLKSALRNHLKNKWNSLINIFSLAIGIACSILIFVYITHEFSFDRFHENAENIYRIYYRAVLGDDEVVNLTLHPHSLVEEFQNNYPVVKRATAYQSTSALIEYNNKRFIENFAKVDSTFLSMFSFPLTAGDPETALLAHDKIVITEKIADKFFGDLNNDYSQVIGEVLTIHGWNNDKDYIITGVLKPVPKNSSLQFDLVMLKEGNDYYSRSNNPFGELNVYVELNDGFNRKDFESSLHPLVEKIYGETLSEFRSKNIIKDTDDSFTLKVQPLADVYMNTDLMPQYVSQSSKMYSYVLGAIGLLILILACINFINLSIGQSLNRTTEIGIRKVLGAGKRQIIFQYSTEKFLLIFLSLIAGYAFAEMLLPMFNQLAQKELNISFYDNLALPVFLISLLFISGFFAAGIPSLVLSRFNPTGVFKAVLNFGGKSRVNSVLVIVQFFLSIILLSSAFIMSNQVSYIHNKDLGFDKDQIVVVPILKEQSDIYRNKILTYPEVINATGTDRNFSNGSSSKTFITQSGKPIETLIIRVEEDYLNTLGIKILEGRNFSNSFPGDKLNSVVVNQTFVEKFELQDPIGAILGGSSFNDEAPIIIGVVNDYHFNSLRQKVEPLILHTTNQINGPWSLLIKIKAGNIKSTIDKLMLEWKQTIPNREFRYTFLDEDINKKYQNEDRWQKIAGISTLLALVISSLGLLGLVSIITNVRTKEIGIRKTLGASISSVVAMLTKDITKWVVIANLLAWPTTWYIMDKWLENYAYHINIDWWIFLLAGGVTLIIALLTTSFKTIKAAMANPVESLRDE